LENPNILPKENRRYLPSYLGARQQGRRAAYIFPQLLKKDLTRSAHFATAAGSHQRAMMQLKFYSRWPFYQHLQRLIDVLILVSGMVIARGLGHHQAAALLSGPLFACLIIVLAQIFLERSGSYSQATMVKFSRQIQALLTGMSMTVLAGVGVSLIDGFRGRDNIVAAGLALGLCLGLMIGARLLISVVINQLLARGYLRERIALVGASERAARIARHLAQQPSHDIMLVGLFDDRRARPAAPLEGCALLGTTDDLVAEARKRHFDRIIVTLPWTAEQRLRVLLNKLRAVPCAIDLCPTNIIWDFGNSDVRRVGGIPLVAIANRQVGTETELVKWIEDAVVASLLLVLLGPLMLAIALLIKLDSPGPVIFRQRRLGFNNRVFEIFKFRSMGANESARGDVRQATPNDPRITRVGRFLRRSSLDELPQIFNVLRGEMSVVGPRPLAVQHNVEFASLVDDYFARHNFKPGITGWAQIHGLRGLTDTPEKIRARAEYDIHYVENWSLLLDVKILLWSTVRVWFQRTAV
jgi:Undecaprenyl-phosphate glucose phosphotransferase